MGIDPGARRGLSTIRLGRVLSSISPKTPMTIQISASVLTLFGALESDVELLPVSHSVNITSVALGIREVIH